MNIIKKLTAVAFALLILFSFSACGKKTPASFTVKKENASIDVSADTDKKQLYASKDKKSMKRVAKSDMIELYFDKETCTVSVYDTASGKLWSSLPENAGSEKTSAVAVTVLIKGNSYTLSSQSDSVGFSSALYEEKENGVTVNYGFKRTLEDGTKLNILLPVSYIISDGALAVEVDCRAVTGENHDSSVAVTHIDVLPYFGSGSKGEKGDCILLPDGCGTTVDLSENPAEFKDVSLPVYENGNLIGAFGMKSGDSAFAVLIDEGEEISSVQAHKALSKGGLNRVYGRFEITPTKSEEDKVYVCNESYKGKIRLLYRFLSHENADYIGMAGAVRELLIRNGYLLSESGEDDSAYPFNLSLVFQNYVTDSRGRTLSQTLTTYSRAQEIIDSLKAKGMENINLRLKGISDGGSAAYSNKPGKMKELENLLSYGDGETVSFYSDAPLITSSSEKSGSSFALSLDGEKLTTETGAFISCGNIGDNTNSLLSLIRDKGMQGVCINDASAYLYGDYSAESLCFKAEMADVISKQTGAVSASGKLMVDTGNIYSVKYADMVVNLPLSAKLQGTDLCTGVPFVQAVLHGLADYSCEPVNKNRNSEKAFLKCIEYGAIPYYEWYASDLSTEEKSDKSYYLNSITEAQSQYERAAAAFEDLRDARITDHYRVKKNVYYTCYDNSTGIYVNYNQEPVSVNGVTVEGMSFLRVN